MNDFISSEQRQYGFKLGTVVASSLSGFIAGALIASIVWILSLSIEQTII